MPPLKKPVSGGSVPPPPPPPITTTTYLEQLATGGAPPDTSMYAAPVEQQYQPGGANYLAPYSPGAAYGMGAPAADPAVAWAQSQPTDLYNTAPTGAYPADSIPATGNPYTSSASAMYGRGAVDAYNGGYPVTAGTQPMGFDPTSTTMPASLPPANLLASMVPADVRWAPPSAPPSAPPRTAPSVASTPPSVNSPAASSGAVSGTTGNPYASALNGGRQAGGQGYAPWPGAGWIEGDTAFPLGFADDWGDDADPFAAMRDNPIFARYFAVLERRYGREGAMRRMRGLSRRFRFGRRIARSIRAPFGSGPHLRTTER